jgi:hypothetical protein
MKNLVKSTVSALIAGALFSTPVFAAFSTTGNQPTLSQTNWDFTRSVSALSGIPATAKITTASIRWGYLTPTYHPNNPASWTVRLTTCVAGTCSQTTSNQVTQSNAWAGQPANSQWNFTFRAISSQTKTFVGGLQPNGPLRLDVNYAN